MNWRIINLVAKKEIVYNIKNYWTMIVAAMLFVLNYGIVHFSVSFSGSATVVSPKAVILSVVHLQMYILPLFALIISYDGMLKERELGTLDLLLSYPLKSQDLVLGKWLGCSAVLTLAFLIGFLPSAYGFMQLGIPVSTIFGVLAFSVWLGVLFTSLGLFLSSFFKDRTVVIASCIIAWVFFVFLFDLGFVILAIVTNGIVEGPMINWVLLFNPIAVFRMISLLSFLPADASSFYGLGTGVLKLSYELIVMLLWTLVPLIITMKKNFVTGKGVHYG